MRYTTVIDINSTYEYEEMTLKQTAEHTRAYIKIYLHLALKSGYHDTDRDMIDISLRNLAWQVGITVSATRHALAMLQRYHLLTRQGNMWTVKKWTVQDTITARPKSQRQQRLQDDEEARRKQREREERQEAAARQEREQLRVSGKTQFSVAAPSAPKRSACAASSSSSKPSTTRRCLPRRTPWTPSAPSPGIARRTSLIRLN